MGLGLFAVVSAGDGRVRVTDVIRGIWPFVLPELALLGLPLVFPALSTWLPDTM